MRTFIVALLAVGAVALSAQTRERLPREPMIQKTTVGSELYRFYCSNCHGQDAKGRPATPSMRTAPNLTVLAANNGGVFPRDVVRDIIAKGPASPSTHRSIDMPEWGTIFRALEPNDTMVNVRIDSLVNYLESLQSTSVGTGAQ